MSYVKFAIFTGPIVLFGVVFNYLVHTSALGLFTFLSAYSFVLTIIWAWNLACYYDKK